MVKTTKNNVSIPKNSKNNIYATTNQLYRGDKPKWYKLSNSNKQSNINVLITLAFIAVIISPIVLSYILFKSSTNEWVVVEFLLFGSWPLLFEMIAILSIGFLVTLLSEKSKYSKRISFLTFLTLAIVSCCIQVLIFLFSTGTF